MFVWEEEDGVCVRKCDWVVVGAGIKRVCLGMSGNRGGLGW